MALKGVPLAGLLATAAAFQFAVAMHVSGEDTPRHQEASFSSSAATGIAVNACVVTVVVVYLLFACAKKKQPDAAAVDETAFSRRANSLAQLDNNGQRPQYIEEEENPLRQRSETITSSQFHQDSEEPLDPSKIKTPMELHMKGGRLAFETSQSLHSLPFFHQGINKSQAEKLMRQYGMKDGLFLVRGKPGGRCALTVVQRGEVLHHMITVTENGEYLLDSQILAPATSLRQFMEVLASASCPWKVPLCLYVPFESEAKDNQEV